MLQQDEPDDYVVATGAASTRSASWSSGVRPRRASTGTTTSRSIQRCSARPRSTRSAATPRQARAELGWQPEVTFPELVKMMVDADLRRVRRELGERDG